MNTFIFVGIVSILMFLVVIGHRYFQMIWWSITVFGVKETLRDFRGLTRTYMALSSIFVSSSSLFQEFRLDLYQVGIRVSCRKMNGKIVHLIHTDVVLNQFSTQLMEKICQEFCGNVSWMPRLSEVGEQGGYEVLKIGCDDVNRFGIAPLTIIYYHLTRHNQIIKTKTTRAPYGSHRPHHSGTVSNYHSTQHYLCSEHLPDITR